MSSSYDKFERLTFVIRQLLYQDGIINIVSAYIFVLKEYRGHLRKLKGQHDRRLHKNKKSINVKQLNKSMRTKLK